MLTIFELVDKIRKVVEGKRKGQKRNPGNQLMNCDGCGRDTNNTSGYCGRCIATGVPHQTEKGTRPGKGIDVRKLGPNDAEDDYSEDSFPR